MHKTCVGGAHLSLSISMSREASLFAIDFSWHSPQYLFPWYEFTEQHFNYISVKDEQSVHETEFSIAHEERTQEKPTKRKFQSTHHSEDQPKKCIERQSNSISKSYLEEPYW